MGMFLNSIEPYDKYKTITKGLYFVDKTELLEELIPALEQEQRFFCITRPRRFGKTVMANMIASFFEKSEGGSDVFDRLKISEYPKYKEHLNKHDVVYIDFSEMPKECDSYKKYISRIEEGIYYDLREKYSDLYLKQEDAIWDIFSKIFNETKKKFIFVMDEWDAVFHMSFMTEKNREDYLLFLKLLLKGQSYVELAYMTGVLPIAKYSDGSELNMFLEYNMATRIRFSEYFGFSDEEVDKLYEKYLQNTKKPQIDREGLREWYDGYHFSGHADGLYNPFSLLNALKSREFGSYWFETGTPTFLVELLLRSHYDLYRLTEELATADSLSGIDTMETNPVPILYQSGYLTVKGYDKRFRTYTLGFPNREVEEGFIKFLLPFYSATSKADSAFEIVNFVHEVENGKIDAFMRRLQSFFSDTPYELVRDLELHYQNVLFVHRIQIVGLLYTGKISHFGRTY